MRNLTMKFFILILLCSSAFAKDTFLDSVKRLNWNGMEVVWVHDDKFPRFTASVYFQDGGLNDSFPGVTQATLDLLTSGTSKESQKELTEFFDFYGVNLKHSVTHEYSIYSVQGLTKDIPQVIGKMCELFNDSQYPAKELTSHVSRAKSGLKNLVTSHSSLADRIFRQKSLEGTPYMYPVDGSISSYDRLTSMILKDRLAQLNKSKKVLYISGPNDIREMEKILPKCGWKSESETISTVLKKPSPQSTLYLVPVPGANQAQIRIGRYLVAEEVKGKNDHFHFLASFLGGGFTSKLVQELRVKRGLTYSAGAYSSMQRDYGRAGIITFSKNETATETISIIRDIFQDVSNGKITPEEFKHSQGHQIGGFAFGFEETTAFLGQIMLYDHQKRKLTELVDFPRNIASMTDKDLARTSLETFPWDRLTIVVVGNKSLAKELARIRPVTILNYQDFL